MNVSRSVILRSILLFGLFIGITFCASGIATLIIEQASETYNWAAAHEQHVIDVYGGEWITGYQIDKQYFMAWLLQNTLDPSVFPGIFGDVDLSRENARISMQVTIEAYRAAMIESKLFNDFTFESIGVVFIDRGYDPSEAAYFGNLFEEFFLPQINLAAVKYKAGTWTNSD